MNAAQTSVAARTAHRCATSSWEDQIDQALATADPTLANLRITAAHHQLSLALRAVLGPATAANFHTWATWGSRKAGQTIRQEEAPYLGAVAALLGGALGLLVTSLALPPSPTARRRVCAAGALLGGWAAQALVQQRRAQASRMILAGNRAVLADIGRQSARFVALFDGRPAPDPARLTAFLDGLRPGPTAAGGQDLLRAAFTCYYQARHAPTAAQRDEAMLLGNLYAVLHEHLRLQPYIAGAMLRPARRLITRHLLAFTLGHCTLRVGEDVVPPDGGAWSSSAQSAEVRAFLAAWGRAGGSGAGSRAANWADLRDRMTYICALFRAGHHDPALFTLPFTAAQQAQIATGRVPAPSDCRRPGAARRLLARRKSVVLLNSCSGRSFLGLAGSLQAKAPWRKVSATL
jgi:hypothetical protein